LGENFSGSGSGSAFSRGATSLEKLYPAYFSPSSFLSYFLICFMITVTLPPVKGKIVYCPSFFAEIMKGGKTLIL
jgi:hypothetical protein